MYRQFEHAPGRPLPPGVAAFIDYEIAGENNTCGLARDSARRTCQESLLWYREIGGEQLTLGSDAHRPEHLLSASRRAGAGRARGSAACVTRFSGRSRGGWRCDGARSAAAARIVHNVMRGRYITVVWPTKDSERSCFARMRLWTRKARSTGEGFVRALARCLSLRALSTDEAALNIQRARPKHFDLQVGAETKPGMFRIKVKKEVSWVCDRFL